MAFLTAMQSFNASSGRIHGTWISCSRSLDMQLAKGEFYGVSSTHELDQGLQGPFSSHVLASECAQNQMLQDSVLQVSVCRKRVHVNANFVFYVTCLGSCPYLKKLLSHLDLILRKHNPSAKEILC